MLSRLAMAIYLVYIGSVPRVLVNSEEGSAPEDKAGGLVSMMTLERRWFICITVRSSFSSFHWA